MCILEALFSSFSSAMNLDMSCSWWICYLRDSGRTFSWSNRCLRFIFLDNFVSKVLLLGGIGHWDFVGFGNGFFLGSVFLVIHIDTNSMHLCNLYASVEGRCWHKNFTCCMCRLLPSIFNTSSFKRHNLYYLWHSPRKICQNFGL